MPEQRHPSIGRGCLRLLCVAAALGCVAEARAHKLNIFAHVEGAALVGQAYYRGMTPARQVAVRFVAPDEKPLGDTRTDDEGKFRFALRYRCDCRIVVDAGEGHGAEFVVAAGEMPGTLPPYPGASAGAPPPPPKPATAANASAAGPAGDVDALRTQIVALRAQLDAFQQETRWRDVLGALGYLFGVCGLAFYFLGVRRRERLLAGQRGAGPQDS